MRSAARTWGLSCLRTTKSDDGPGLWGVGLMRGAVWGVVPGGVVWAAPASACPRDAVTVDAFFFG